MSPAAPARPPEHRSVADDVAHDLRGLLAIVKGFAELLLLEGASSEHCGKILRACKRMSEIVDGCQDPGRSETEIPKPAQPAIDPPGR